MEVWKTVKLAWDLQRKGKCLYWPPNNEGLIYLDFSNNKKSYNSQREETNSKTLAAESYILEQIN